MNQIVVDIYIPADEYLRYYQGTVRDVVANARDGRSVKFPANILKPFVTHEGIKGSFIIEYDVDNKFKEIRRN